MGEHIKQLTQSYFPRLSSVGFRDRPPKDYRKPVKLIRKTNGPSLENTIRQLAVGRTTALVRDHSHRPNSIVTLDDPHHRSNYWRTLSSRRRLVAGGARRVQPPIRCDATS